MAVIPVKRFASAKQRAAPALGEEGRQALAQAMLSDVLFAVARSNALERVLVVTGEVAAVRLAARIGAEVVPDPDDRGHSEAAVRGAAHAETLGAEAVAMLPGDCPLLDPSELDALIDALGADSVTVVPDRHGTGTNGLLLSPPQVIGPAFGPGSCASHRARGEAAGIAVTVTEAGSLAMDLDTPEDLVAMTAALRDERARAPATAATLDELGLL